MKRSKIQCWNFNAHFPKIKPSETLNLFIFVRNFMQKKRLSNVSLKNYNADEKIKSDRDQLEAFLSIC